MKKTLVALAVTAFAASASAVTVYDAEGSKVELDGSLRLILEKASTKTTTAAGVKSGDSSKSTLRNAGSRFGVKVKHNLGEDFYALGRLEFRFDDTESKDEFGRLYAKRAYIGLGSKQFGEITFGRQVTISDDLSQNDDYEYGIVPKGSYIPTSGTQVIRYDYRGVEGLKVSANYNFAQKHNDKGNELKLTSRTKNSYGVGAIYAVDRLDARAAIARTNYETGTNDKHYKDGYLASLSYQVLDNFTLNGDFGYAHEKNGDTKTNKFYVSPGFRFQALPKSAIYGNYLYEHVKVDEGNKSKTHGFLLGTDYKFHKQVIVYVEGKYLRTKGYTNNDTYTGKTVDKAIGVGMRVYW